MSPLLPMKEMSREVVVEVTRSLQPYFPEITAEWRRTMFSEFNFDGRAMAALERLTIGTGFSIFSQTRLRRLLREPAALRQTSGQAEGERPRSGPFAGNLSATHRPLPGEIFPPARLAEAVAAMETLSWASYVAVSGAYFDAQKIGVRGAALGARCGALRIRNLEALLQRVLEISRAYLQRHPGIDSADRFGAAGPASTSAGRFWRRSERPQPGDCYRRGFFRANRGHRRTAAFFPT